jgi:transposase, IS5 family
MTGYPQGQKMPPKVYADKGYCSQDNREFLSLSQMADGIMRKDYRNAKLTELAHERNKGISKIRYQIEQYFGFLPVGHTARRD